VRNVADEVKVGQEVTVMVIGNENGKIRLSRRAVLEGMTLEEAQEADRGGGRGGPRRATNNGGKRPSPPTRGGGPERGGRAGRR
jgi:polyribonucleotide nucleotidyltransferase